MAGRAPLARDDDAFRAGPLAGAASGAEVVQPLRVRPGRWRARMPAGEQAPPCRIEALAHGLNALPSAPQAAR